MSKKLVLLFFCLHKELPLDKQTESKLSFVCSRLVVLFSAPEKKRKKKL